ncbi:hypothetical protein M9H77_08348 [Catharanthus roseus]|uniref:Uncharacterized protein n=1 Tax=Catharanthus roseus TaxID=4058 RepID=A0ACC0BXX9_CATRO|nr:hypothetical protein M9H77_08348 [Catharanthus roseus]
MVCKPQASTYKSWLKKDETPTVVFKDNSKPKVEEKVGLIRRLAVRLGQRNAELGQVQPAHPGDLAPLYIYSLAPSAKAPFSLQPLFRLLTYLPFCLLFFPFLFFWSAVTVDHDWSFDAVFCVHRCSVWARIAEGSFFYRLLDISATGASTRFTDLRRYSASTAGLVVAISGTVSNTAAVGKLSVSMIPVCFYSDGPCRFAVFRTVGSTPTVHGKLLDILALKVNTLPHA